MLRAQSVGDRAKAPLAGADDSLAEMGKQVAEARAEMARLVQLGELQNDPIRHPIQALSVHLDAVYKLAEATQKDLAALVAVVGKPIDNWTLSQGVAEGIRNYAHSISRSLQLRTWLVGAAAVVVALLAAGAVGFLLRGWLEPTPQPAEFQCIDQQDGSRICYYYSRLPISHGAQR